MFQDRTLACKDCGNDFTFTVGEQEFFSSKGFQNDPARCKDCRDLNKKQFNSNSSQKRERILHDAVCADCGKETKIPFKPHLEKPVFCSECFAARS